MNPSSLTDPNFPTSRQPPSELYERMMEALTIGRDSAIKLRSRLLVNGSAVSDDNDHELGGDRSNYDHVNIILASFAGSLSLLEANQYRPQVQLDDYKVETDNNNDNGGVCYNGGFKSGQGSVRCVTKLSVKDRRGLYKRRKAYESWEKITEMPIDDGYAWRKYGQKPIHGSIHPRSYYRCTYKAEHCRAMKQVQKVEDNPETYKTTYFGHHTCQNHQKTTQQLLIDDVHDDDDDHKNMLSFQMINLEDALNNQQLLMPPAEYSSASPMLSTAHNYNDNQQYYNSILSVDYDHVSSTAGSTGEAVCGVYSPCSPSQLISMVDDGINNYMMIGHDGEINAVLNHCF